MTTTDHAAGCHRLVADLCAHIQKRNGYYSQSTETSIEELTTALQAAHQSAEGYSLMLCEIGLMLAEYAEYRPAQATTLSHAVGWMRENDQLSGLLEDANLLDAYIEKYGTERLAYTYYQRLSYACDGVRNAALQAFVEGVELPLRVRDLYAVSPEVLMEDESAAHHQIVGRLLKIGGVPPNVSSEWLSGIDVAAISEAFGIHDEKQKMVFASLGEGRVENLEMLAEAVQALFGETQT
jgi:hypothetical protein